MSNGRCAYLTAGCMAAILALAVVGAPQDPWTQAQVITPEQLAKDFAGKQGQKPTLISVAFGVSYPEWPHSWLSLLRTGQEPQRYREPQGLGQVCSKHQKNRHLLWLLSLGPLPQCETRLSSAQGNGIHPSAGGRDPERLGDRLGRQGGVRSRGDTKPGLARCAPQVPGCLDMTTCVLWPPFAARFKGNV